MSAIQPATESQQKYADKAAYYVGRAVQCYDLGLWPEAANHFGSALESLLRIRYGSGGKLAGLIKKFDADDLFNNVVWHDGATKECVSCYADRARILRNSVHPDCWIEATKDDVCRSGTLVVLVYHVLFVCSTRVAEFKDSADSTLRNMEASAFLFGDAPAAGMLR